MVVPYHPWELFLDIDSAYWGVNIVIFIWVEQTPTIFWLADTLPAQHSSPDSPSKRSRLRPLVIWFHVEQRYAIFWLSAPSSWMDELLFFWIFVTQGPVGGTVVIGHEGHLYVIQGFFHWWKGIGNKGQKTVWQVLALLNKPPTAKLRHIAHGCHGNNAGGVEVRGQGVGS